MSMRTIVSAALAAALAAASLLVAPAAVAADEPAESLQVEEVPFPMDEFNRAGWWHPVAEADGATYFVFNTPAATERRHQVRLAKRDADGVWTSACLPAAESGCAEFLDDSGHAQPSIAIDGDGYVHAFVSMHYSAWQYYRSATPGSVAMVDASADMPDQGSTFTYPVIGSAPNGDVYLLIRANPIGEQFVGEFYRYELAEHAWSKVTTIAADPAYTPYPDDVQVDSDGRVHVLWEWALGATSGERHYGTYIVYDPVADAFSSASGAAVTAPVDHLASQYESGDGVIQTARLALADGEELAGVAYRYDATASGQYAVQWASWDGSAWTHEVLPAPAGDTTATIGATAAGGIVRVYVNHETADCTDLDTIWRGGLHVLERRGSAPWEDLWLGGARNTSQLSALARADGTDVLYLSAWASSPIDEPSLYYATLARDAVTVPAAPGSGRIPEGDDVLAGATVTPSSTRSPTFAECAADGNYWGENSRWVSEAGDPAPTLTLTLDTPRSMSEFRVYTGTRGSSINMDFTVYARIDGTWVRLADVHSPTSPGVLVLGAPVVADAVRIVFPRGTARVYEVAAYEQATTPALGAYGAASDPPFIEQLGGDSEATFTVFNRSSETIVGQLDYDAPAGWTVTPAVQDYALAPGAQQTVAVQVTAPTTGSFQKAEIAVVDANVGTVLSIPVQVRDGILHASDGAPWYVDEGGWLASGLVGYDDTPSRYVDGQTCASATWTATLPTSGVYTVSVFATANSETSRQAVFTVTHANGQTPVAVDQVAASGQWLELGAFEFEQGGEASVTLSAFAAGFHRAGSVRFQAGGELTPRPAFPAIDSPCAGVPEPYEPSVLVTETFNRSDLTWDWEVETVATKGEVTVTKPAGGHNGLLIDLGGLTAATVEVFANGGWSSVDPGVPIDGPYGSDIQELRVSGWT